MTENLQYQWQLDELADSMLISSRQLERRCKDSLGCGPIQYLRLLRLHAAAALLRTKHEQITQIAQQVGIPDARYFRRSFKELYSVSPGEYRQQQAKHVVFSPQMSEISPLSRDESLLT